MSDRHLCRGGLPTSGGWGSCVDECEEDERGCFWVTNYEVSDQVNFCPYCGAKAPTQVAIIRNYYTGHLVDLGTATDRDVDDGMLKRVWMVRDEDPSVLDDAAIEGEEHRVAHLLFGGREGLDIGSFMRIVFGTSPSTWWDENTKVYIDAAAARKDAERRLAKMRTQEDDEC